MSIREKFFNWTPKDVADWEKIREKGLTRFIWGYGILFFGGTLFILLGVIDCFLVVNQMRTSNLIAELGFIAFVCLLGGLVASLATWWMEEKLYQKFKKIHGKIKEQV